MNLPTIEKLHANFASCNNWEQKYSYIIELGKKLPGMTADQKTVQNKVVGCQSKVWLVIDVCDKGIQITGDSDSIIVKGLVAIIAIIYARLSLKEAAAFDPMPVLTKLSLQRHLTPSRNQGLDMMIKKIRITATALISLY